MKNTYKSLTMLWAMMTLCIFVFTGCDARDSAELELLKREDAGFTNLIEMQDQMEQRIASLKQEMSIQKKLAESQVNTIKEQAEAEAAAQKKLIEEIQKKISETKDGFEQDVNKIVETIVAKDQLEKKLISAVDHASQILSQSETVGLTAQEVIDWQAKVQSLTERLATVKSELVDLRAQENLKRKKLKYL